jgi:hypothetical protein
MRLHMRSVLHPSVSSPPQVQTSPSATLSSNILSFCAHITARDQYSELTPWSWPYTKSQQLLSESRNLLHFMEPATSLPSSLVPISSQLNLVHSSSYFSNIRLLPVYVWGDAVE